MTDIDQIRARVFANAISRRYVMRANVAGTERSATGWSAPVEVFDQRDNRFVPDVELAGIDVEELMRLPRPCEKPERA